MKSFIFFLFLNFFYQNLSAQNEPYYGGIGRGDQSSHTSGYLNGSIVFAGVEFSLQPPSITSSNANFTIIIRVFDQLGNTLTSFNDQVFMSINDNPYLGTLSGTTVVNANSGIAIFNGLSINNIGLGYSLSATNENFQITSSLIDIYNIYFGGIGRGDTFSFTSGYLSGPLIYSGIEFSLQPPSVSEASKNFSVIIRAFDQFGNTVTSLNNQVVLSINDNPSFGTLNGMTTVNASSGVAVFNGLSIDDIGIGYSLLATNDNFQITSSLIDIYNIFFGGVGRGDTHTTYQAPALGNYFTGVTSDFTLNSNWSSGSFPSNEIGIVRATGTQPILSGTFSLHSNSHIYLQDQSTLILNPNSLLSVEGSLEGEGTIIIKSDASGTATIGNSTGTIALNAEVERYIPTVPVENFDGRRAYRLLTMPLKGSSNNSVFVNCQNNGTITGTLGMDIWGPNGTGAAGNGLAVGPFYSLLKYPTSLPATGWVNVTNTKTEPLFDVNRNYGFLAFPTGSYGDNIISGFDNAQPTTLKARGNLMIGIQNYTNLPLGLHTLIPNPYAAPLSPAALLETNIDFRDKIWVWDPKLAPTGGYVVYDKITGYSNLTGSYDANTQIQLGQAFMVRPEVEGSTFTINESHKGTTVNNGVLARQSVNALNNQVDVLRVSLHKLEQQTWYPSDAVVCAFYDGGNAQVDLNDGGKLSKPGENISIRRNASNLTVEHRGLLTVQDTIPMRLTGMIAGQNHQLRIQTNMVNSYELNGRLQDLFNGQEVNFSLDGSILEYNFATDTSSGLQDRFRIIFEAQPLSQAINEHSPIQLWPNPITEEVFYVRSSTYIEKCKGSISNIHGQLLQSFEVDLSNQTQPIELLSSIGIGIYFVKIEVASGDYYIHKILISK